MIHYQETMCGFEYGAAKITRMAYDDRRGWVVVRIETPRGELQVCVTKSGKVNHEWIPRKKRSVNRGQ